MWKITSTSQPGNVSRLLSQTSCCGHYRANTSCTIPPVKNLRRKPCSWKRWWVPAHWSGAAKTICGTICSAGVDKSSGWDLADAKMPTVWTGTKQSRTMGGAMTNSPPCDGRPKGSGWMAFPAKPRMETWPHMQEYLCPCFLLLFLLLNSSAALQGFREILCASLSHLLERLCGEKSQSIDCQSWAFCSWNIHC